MLIVGCQKCGEIKVLAGEPDSTGTTTVVWTCSHCGTGQLLELAIKKDVHRGDLNKIVRGFALSRSRSKVIEENSLSVESKQNDFLKDA